MPSGEPKLADSAMRGANVSNPQRTMSSVRRIVEHARAAPCPRRIGRWPRSSDVTVFIAYRLRWFYPARWPCRGSLGPAVGPGSTLRTPGASAARARRARRAWRRKPPKSPFDIITTTSPGCASAATQRGDGVAASTCRAARPRRARSATSCSGEKSSLSADRRRSACAARRRRPPGPPPPSAST